MGGNNIISGAVILKTPPLIKNEGVWVWILRSDGREQVYGDSFKSSRSTSHMRVVFWNHNAKEGENPYVQLGDKNR